MQSDTRENSLTNEHSIHKKISTIPLCSSAVDELVTDFKRLLISTLIESYSDVDPVKVIYTWLNKMKLRCLEDKKSCVTKNDDSICFKMLSISKNDFLLCKPIYGTVDLKTGLHIFENTLRDTEKDISERYEKAKEYADLMKEVVTGITFEQAALAEYVVVPIFKARSKKTKQRSESQSKTADTTCSAAQGSEPELEASEKPKFEEGVCASKTEINSPSSDNNDTDNNNNNVTLATATTTFTTTSTTTTDATTTATATTTTMATATTSTSATATTTTMATATAITTTAATATAATTTTTTTTAATTTTTAATTTTITTTTTTKNDKDMSRNLTSQKDKRSDSRFTDPVINRSSSQSFEPLLCIIKKLSRGESVPPQVSMQYEMLRFCTLRSFPKENKPYITRIAQAGFYYANNSDEVVCYCCAQRKRNWEEHDIPMDVHRQLNPNCKYLLRNSEVNVPIKKDESFAGILTSLQDASNLRSARRDAVREDRQQLNREVASTTSNTLDYVVQSSNKIPNHSTIGSIFSNQNEVQRNKSVSSLQRLRASNSYPHGHFVQASAPKLLDYKRRQQAASNKAFEPLNSRSGRPPTQTGGGEFGTPPTALPKYPKYAIRTVRMSSFSDCGDIVVSPESLVEAGFFYAGFGDCVRCFQCGVGLRHWSVEDDPWIEHSRWSKECSYVSKMRGQEFVNLVQMAVQYQSNQQSNETAQNENFAGSNQRATGRDEVETLLHKNAAQSVLEMGYHPDLIRTAIRAVLEEKGREAVSASNLMEKIFEIEEGETPSEISVEQEELLELSNQTINHTASSRFDSEPSTSLIERKESQRFAETTRGRGELQSARTAENMETRSHASLSVQLASAQSGSSNNTRVSRSSQILEKRKLKEENEKLKQQSICTNCGKNEVCIVFLPCGHLVTCETCAPTIKYCTVQSCGKYIKGTVRTYLS